MKKARSFNGEIHYIVVHESIKTPDIINCQMNLFLNNKNQNNCLNVEVPRERSMSDKNIKGKSLIDQFNKVKIEESNTNTNLIAKNNFFRKNSIEEPKPLSPEESFMEKYQRTIVLLDDDHMCRQTLKIFTQNYFKKMTAEMND